MKVLHVIPGIAARYGGPSAAVVGMCRALQGAGVEPLIASTDADGAGRLAVPTGRVTTFEGVPAVFFPRQVSESFKWSAPLSQWLREHAAEFDVVHVHAVFSHSSIAAGRACRRSRVPYIVRPLGTLDPWSLSRHPWRKKLLFAVAVRRLLERAAAIHYTTDEERRLAQPRVGNHVPGVVVPLGIDDELFVRADEDGSARAPIVLALNRLHPKKGMELLIDAFHNLAGVESLKTWRLVIAGDGPAEHVADLEGRAAAGPAHDRIDFPGWLDRAARREALRQARLFVLPSHQENFGIAVVEAMATGLPVLVSPGVNLARAISDAGAGWVSERAVEPLTAMLRAALLDPAALQRCGVAARQFALQFRWSTVADGLRAMYEQVQHAAAAPDAAPLRVDAPPVS